MSFYNNWKSNGNGYWDFELFGFYRIGKGCGIVFFNFGVEWKS